MAYHGFEESISLQPPAVKKKAKSIYDYVYNPLFRLNNSVIFAEFHRQYLASDGFDIDVYPKDPFIRENYTVPMSPLQFANSLDLLTRLSKLAIDLYNCNNNTNYRVVRVVKSTMRSCSGSEFKITFEAIGYPGDASDGQAEEDASDSQAEEDATDGHTKIFQASVWNGVKKDEVKVNFCRLKPTN